MDSSDNLPSIVSEPKLAWVLKQMAIYTPMTKIKTEYLVLFGEPITGERLVEIESTYKELISDISKKELRNFTKRRLAHSAIRLDIISQGLEIASTPRPVRSVRTGENEYEVINEPDHASVAKYLKLAQDEEFFAKKLMLEVIKSGLDAEAKEKTSKYEVVEIEDGF